MLKHLKQLADSCLQLNITNVVVAVPAYFNMLQRQLTTEACNQAGLHVLQLVNEPTAAAIAYSIHSDLKEGSTVKQCLVFHFGGRTFNVTVLNAEATQIIVKTTGGDTNLGGQDIDNNMVAYCTQQFQEKYGIDLNSCLNSNDPEEVSVYTKKFARLKLECEKSKKHLSYSTSKTIYMDAIHGDKALEVILSRQVFDSINNTIFERCISIMKKVLLDANIDKGTIAEIILVGGSCRIPRVQRMVSEFFDGKELCISIYPDETVVTGAAKLALDGGQAEIPNVLLYDSQTIELSAASVLHRSLQMLPKEDGNSCGSKESSTISSITSGLQPWVSYAVGAGASILSHAPQKISLIPGYFSRSLSSVMKTKLKEAEEFQNSGQCSQTANEILDVGMYIDETSVKISSYKQNMTESTGTFTEIVSTSPWIQFSEKTIVIGDEYEIAAFDKDKQCNDYFNIFELLVDVEQKGYPFVINGLKHELSAVEIIAIFIRRSFDLGNISPGANITITLPVNLSFEAHQRLRRSVDIVGFRKVHIMSTLASLAVEAVEKSEIYTSLKNPEKVENVLVVLDVRSNSLSVGMVAMNNRKLCVEAGTEISPEKQALQEDTEFLKWHNKMISGEEIPTEAKTIIYQAYEEVINAYLTIILVTKVLAIGTESPAVYKIVEEIVEKKSGTGSSEVLLIQTRALVGASLHSSLTSGAVFGYLPFDVQILDYVWYNFKLKATDTKGNENVFNILNDGITIEVPYNTWNQNPVIFNAQLIVSQNYFACKTAFEAFRYSVILKLRSRLSDYLLSFLREEKNFARLTIEVMAEDDGDYSLQANWQAEAGLPLSINIEKLNTAQKSSETSGSMEFEKLIAYYEFKRNL